MQSSAVVHPPHASRSSLGDGGELISGRYRVERPLGEGGMASVWCVRDQETQRKLALKRLSRAANAKLLALFEREFHTLRSLRHPAIVEAYDYATDAVGPYYTMELLEGSDVSALAPMPWQRVCRILRDVASGIALLHARRLLHRDLSARNIWLTPDGRVKLIDFGTMAAFGRSGDIVGTPPFVAPEATAGLELDQRTDLYALGALAYFLLTGRHAFPARSFAALESLWQEPPKPASQRVAELNRSDLPAIPEALDALIDALLNRHVLARPKSAAELIDRLSVIASLEPERPVHLLESYLRTPSFVGRAAEQDKLRAAFDAALDGSARNVMVESAPGLGKSRLLAELALEARLQGATVLAAEAQRELGTHEVVQQLSLSLLSALPSEARAAAKPYAPVLGHLSAQLRARLGLGVQELAEVPQTHGEARMRVQAALRDWFLDVARTHPLVILADDVNAFDDGSSAWLAALSLEAKQHKLLIVGSLRSDLGELSLPVQALRQGAERLVLEPLSHDEMHELFRSVFGDVAYVARVVDRIQQHALGSPAHAIDLAEHLSREGAIAYADGTWLLPQNIETISLPENRVDAELARLLGLSKSALALGQVLSIREGAIPHAMCAAIAGREAATLHSDLEELVRMGVLTRAAEGYTFARSSLRGALHTQLAPEEKKRAHRRLGELLLGAPELSELERLKAGVHLLQGGDTERGSLEVARAGKHYGLIDLADLGPAAAALETALQHFRVEKRSAYEEASLLAPLALAGYYADKRLAARYGMEAVELLQRLVGLSTARRLQPFLGKKLGLLLALAWAALGFALRRRNPRIPQFRQSMMLLFNCVAALTGASVVCLDLVSARRYTRVIEPMTALGPNHVASFMYDFCNNLIGTILDHPAEGRSRWIRMIDRLDQPRTKRDLGDVHALYLAGALYARGVGECRRDDSAALECADRLQSFGLKLYDMSADQVRMVYYGNRGDLASFERYRNKVEVHAIQRGTAWQVETWMYSSLTYISLRTGDVAALKDCAEQLKRMSAEVPSLKSEHTRALASYLVLRGTPDEALALMDENPEEPCLIVGWARCQGVRARAQNALGQHAEARKTCLFALEYLTDEDLAFCGNNLGVLIELARADAGLSNREAAEARLRDLLEEFAPFGNPLTLGTLHEALAELARKCNDSQAFVREAAAVDRYFRKTGHPALVARAERLSQLARPHEPKRSDDAATEGGHLVTVLHNLRHGGDLSVVGSAEWALRQVAELTEVTQAYLFVREEGPQAEVRCAAKIGSGAPLEALTALVNQQMRFMGGDIATCTMGADNDGDVDAQLVELDDSTYRLTLLRASDGSERVVGALLTLRDAVIPKPVIREVAARMQASVSMHTTA